MAPKLLKSKDSLDLVFYCTDATVAPLSEEVSNWCLFNFKLKKRLQNMLD